VEHEEREGGAEEGDGRLTVLLLHVPPPLFSVDSSCYLEDPLTTLLNVVPSSLLPRCHADTSSPSHLATSHTPPHSSTCLTHLRLLLRLLALSFPRLSSCTSESIIRGWYHRVGSHVPYMMQMAVLRFPDLKTFE